MQHFCKFLLFCLLFCASAFSQEIGIVQCDSEKMTSVPAWVSPGKPQVIEQLSCDQIVSVIGKGRYLTASQYSSRPSKYVQIEIGDSVGYVDACYIKTIDSQEGLKVVRNESVAAEKPNTREEEEQKKWNLIAKGDVQLRDESLLKPMYQNGPRTFTATLNNRSGYPVSHLRMLVRLYDCSGRPDSNYSNCEIIGEVKPVVSAPVPAGQTRKIISSMMFEATPRVRGRFAWGYSILGVRAE
jgi:hypothetical protein